MSILESLLFASERPLGLRELKGWLPEADGPAIREALAALAERCQTERRGYQVAEVAGGYQLRTNPENAEWVRRMLRARPVRLSRAALESLAIIAYRQPITRAEIEDVRGVDSGGVLKMLLERRLVKILGKKEEPGRPILYGTTREFLEFFGLKDLTQLPTLREFHELTEESSAKLEESGLADVAPDTPAAAEPAAAATDAPAAAEPTVAATDAPAAAEPTVAATDAADRPAG